MRNFAPLTLAAAIVAATFVPVQASESGTKTERGSHSGMEHGEMKAPENVNEAEAKGKINTIDADAGVVNVTHEPVEKLGWPTMTMDLPVTRRVDLTTVKPGADVTFKLKKGRDDKFRITEITPAE